jgi:hypothetical protein
MFKQVIIVKKDIYINRRNLIVMSEQLKKKQIEQLYKDAFNHSLLKDGSNYRREVEMRRRKALWEEL